MLTACNHGHLIEWKKVQARRQITVIFTARFTLSVIKCSFGIVVNAIFYNLFL